MGNSDQGLYKPFKISNVIPNFLKILKWPPFQFQNFILAPKFLTFCKTYPNLNFQKNLISIFTLFKMWDFTSIIIIDPLISSLHEFCIASFDRASSGYRNDHIYRPRCLMLRVHQVFLYAWLQGSHQLLSSKINKHYQIENPDSLSKNAVSISVHLINSVYIRERSASSLALYVTLSAVVACFVMLFLTLN